MDLQIIEDRSDSLTSHLLVERDMASPFSCIRAGSPRLGRRAAHGSRGWPGRDRRAEITDVRRYERFRQAEKLNKQDCEAIILLLDGVLAQRSIEAQIERRRRA